MGKFELPPWDKELRFCNVKRGDLVLMKSGHYAIVTKIRNSPFEDAAGYKLPPHVEAVSYTHLTLPTTPYV